MLCPPLAAIEMMIHLHLRHVVGIGIRIPDENEVDERPSIDEQHPNSGRDKMQSITIHWIPQSRVLQMTKLYKLCLVSVACCSISDKAKLRAR